MRPIRPWLAGFVVAGLGAVLLLTPDARGGDVGFVEDFALAKDRTTALKQLIPGTEDYYYFHCLHYLHTGQFDKIEAMTGPWYERHRQTARLTEIQTRHALLAYDKDPKKALDYVRNRLGLYFNHERETLGATPNLPIALDQSLISRATLKASSLSRWGNFDNFEDVALDYMAAEKLTWEQRRNLLQRLQRPDITALPKLVVEDLKSPHSGEFGGFAIHKQMTLAQLDE